mmetsp:Transcript_4049/g.4145  ORF Transcript_4049/g.4145 Transcript_4049/m.4145 type:complete len:202 (-) Transcript_4049:119-724(-)
MKLTTLAILSLFASVYSFRDFLTRYKRTYSLHASQFRECRTWMGLKRQKELENLNRVHPLDIEFLLNNSFDLYEIVDSGSFQSSLALKEDGKVVICSTDGPDCSARGSWSLHSDILRMVIERTYEGKYTEYSIKSHYLGTLGEDASKENSPVIKGDICDVMCNPEQDLSRGKFFLINYTPVHIILSSHNFNKASIQPSLTS